MDIFSRALRDTILRQCCLKQDEPKQEPTSDKTSCNRVHRQHETDSQTVNLHPKPIIDWTNVQLQAGFAGPEDEKSQAAPVLESYVETYGYGTMKVYWSEDNENLVSCRPPQTARSPVTTVHPSDALQTCVSDDAINPLDIHRQRCSVVPNTLDLEATLDRGVKRSRPYRVAEIIESLEGRTLRAKL